MRYLAIVIAALLLSTAARAEPPTLRPSAGDAFILTLERNSSSQGPAGSTGSSFDRWTFVERVIAVKPDGLELEFDLPDETDPAARQDQWKYPARIFKPDAGPARLLNREELDRRVDTWLASAHWPRAVCGRWIFTWTAYQIECDPQLALENFQLFDLDIDNLREGGLHQEIGTLGSAPFRRLQDASGKVSFTVELTIDPDAVRRSNAEMEVAVGEMTGRPISMEAAVQAHAKDSVSGTVVVTFDVDSTGAVWRRTKVSTLEIKKPDSQAETRTTTETLVRSRKV